MRKGLADIQVKIEHVNEECDVKCTNVRNEVKVEVYDMNNRLNQQESKASGSVEKSLRQLDAYKLEIKTDFEKMKKDFTQVNADVNHPTCRFIQLIDLDTNLKLFVS
jgi:hypothetical protein